MFLPDLRRPGVWTALRRAQRRGPPCTLALLAAAACHAGQAAELPQSNWRVERGDDETCVLISQPLSMPDGYGSARVQLIFGPRALRVVTDSNIDNSYPDQGLSIDDGPPFAPDVPFPLDAQSALFEQSVDDIVEQFRRGYRAQLRLGYWPTWPVTETQRLDISLTGFSKAHDALLVCRGASADASE
ncbi:MAG: hypothetical protein K9M02_18760 [Thiohalocapsa sp.]|nr:hypothetical protein [Thiohalocapsa sp.]